MTYQNQLFNLIAQRDSNANIELAKDSRTIALASRQDSAAMKTIAIMTMAFLPATFFATLFATPLLQWNTPHVIQKSFWVFWAFTVPVTILIFIIWIAITRRHELRKRVEIRRQRAKIRKKTKSLPQRRADNDSPEDSSDDESAEATLHSRTTSKDVFQ
jgi:flagellar biosynthesis/type III secretory pathway M-ring protein FliF/YscJ